MFESHFAGNSRIPAVARERIRAAMTRVPAQADLETRLAAAAGSGEIASTYVTHLDEVRGAGQALASVLSSVGGPGGSRATAELFASLRGQIVVR